MTDMANGFDRLNWKLVLKCQKSFVGIPINIWIELVCASARQWKYF